MKYDCFVGIDPGKSGGIAVIDRDGLRTFKMPQSIRLMVDLLTVEAETHQSIMVVLERIGIYRTDMQKGGKVFNIARMIENFTECRSALKMAGMSFKLVEARKWQSYLRLSRRGDTKTVRKNRFKSFAQSVYPGTKITMDTSDAICLAIFAYKANRDEPILLEMLPGND